MRTLILIFTFLVLSSLCENTHIHGLFIEDDRCYSGTIEFLNYRNGGVLRVQEKLEVGTVNLNQTNGKIIVSKNGELTINSSLNLNGTNLVQVYGILRVKAIEMQGLDAKIEVIAPGKIICEEIQMSHASSHIRNCGTIEVSNAFNAHQGIYEGCNCSTLQTNILNVNKANAFVGFGNIKVTGNFNLNQTFSQSLYNICYSGHLNQPEKLGGSKLSCDFTCQEQPLPLIMGNLSAKKTESGIELSIPVISVDKVKQVSVMMSKDGETWERVKIIPGSEFKAGVTYVTHIAQ